MRLLVIEDDTELREAVLRRLRRLGHGADGAEELAEAEGFVHTYTYDVLILDRMLPDGDGVTWLEEHRTQGMTTPVLVLTALGGVSDRVAGLVAGADDYLVKPFAMDELVARIGALGRRVHAPRASQITIGRITLDTGRRAVRKDGVVLPLRPKEYAVLELLLSMKGRVVSHERLLASAWGEDQQPASNAHEVIIAALRRKLATRDLIRTVRGTGYIVDG